MIRKISLFLLAFCAVAMAAAAEYQVLALGDIHYDNAQYHPSNEGNKWQMNERSRYLKMWRGASPELLTSAAAMLNDSFPFVIQLGDFVQGDSDTGELQQQLVQEAFSKVKGFKNTATGELDIYDPRSGMTAEEKDELLRQIHILQEMGMGGYFCHSRTGLETEYLGEEWFELIRACAEKGDDLGMETWLYDEDRWPSATATPRRSWRR